MIGGLSVPKTSRVRYVDKASTSAGMILQPCISIIVNFLCYYINILGSWWGWNQASAIAKVHTTVHSIIAILS